MSSKYSAARPKRDGETFARIHHGEGTGDDGPSAKKVRFDVRNPSALAPDAGEEDDVLEADVIGGGGAGTKRGAVNIDGYDSDSDNERNFKARATAREKKSDKVNLAEQLDKYDSKANGAAAADNDDDMDMFAGEDDNPSDGDDLATKSKDATTDKNVRFLDDRDIEGQEKTSRSGGHVRLDEEESSDDEEEVELEIQEEGVDEEVGAGGLKHHAPKIDAFNMREEQEEGAFDEAGNYVRKAVDPNAVHDKWLDGVSKKEMKKAAEAQQKRDAEARQRLKAEDLLQTSDLIDTLLQYLEKGETSLEALARFGKLQPKERKIPKWKQKKQSKDGDAAAAMDVDRARPADDAESERVKEAINAITEAADKLLGRGYAEIYDTERELLLREYRKESGGEDWAGPDKSRAEASMWEYRWTDGRDGADKQGPFDGRMMKAWQDAGYFGEGVEFRPVGQEGIWTRTATFV